MKLDHVLGLKCVLCGAEYDIDEITYVCPKHGDEGIVDVIYDYDIIKTRLTKAILAHNRDYSVWRYKLLLPVAMDSPVPPLDVGWTPLYHAKRLGEKLGLSHVYVKDDGRNPSASFKDRASVVGVVRAQELGRDIITAASTGNAAASLACITASVDIPTRIFVPRTAPQAKIAQLLVFGATVITVNGTYDDAFDLCLQASANYGWYSRNTAYNPYLSEGKKTASLEICEQLAWNAPDKIFVPVGDGCIIGGMWKGLKDLYALGLIERMPQLIGVQAEGSAALYTAWQKGTEEVERFDAHTVADSISSELPRDRIKALRAVRETNGKYITVSDAEILAAIPELGRNAAVFAEPAAAASYAGLKKMAAAGEIAPEERVVVMATGSGLKDVQSAIKAVGEPYLIDPTFDALEKLRAENGNI